MADSATRRPDNPPSGSPPCVAVAYSGGLDSTALLWATVQAAHGTGLRVAALHVHHGLMAEADAWEQQAQQVVAQLQQEGHALAFHVAHLPGAPAPGDSVEAWARRGRYQALAAMASTAGASLVLLAHHAQDQAETVLLQALRGGGPAGLAAMPSDWQSGGLRWARPWLKRTKAEVQALALQSGLPCVTDPSNGDPRFARSRLRGQVWPALVEAFPQTAVVLGQVAERAAHARALADEVAALDLPACADAEGHLAYAPWSALPPARRRNALAAWLALQLPHGVPNALLERIDREWHRQGARWQAPGGEVRAVKGLLGFHPSPATK